MKKQEIKNGFFHGWAVGLGSMTIDLTLIIALYLGPASILALPYVQLPLWMIGACFLAIIGYDSIKNADKDITLTGEKPSKSLWKTYRNGVLVAVHQEILSSGFLFSVRFYPIHTVQLDPGVSLSLHSLF